MQPVLAITDHTFHDLIVEGCEFAKALARGEKDRWEIIKTVAENKVREVI